MLLGTFFEKVRTALHSQVCLHCEQKAVANGLQFCRQCDDVLGLRTPVAVIDTPHFLCHAATSLNPAVKKLLYGYKFHNQFVHGSRLSGLLIQYWNSLPLPIRSAHPETVLVVPVPPHADKISRIDAMASRFARHFGFDYRPDALSWTRSIEPQHTILDKRQRYTNIAGGLSVNPDVLAGHEKIIIVDDLTTTGATLHEANRAIREMSLGLATQPELITLAVAKVPLASQRR